MNRYHHQRATLIHELRATIRDAEQATALRGAAEEFLRSTQEMRRERLAKLRDIRKDIRDTFQNPGKAAQLARMIAQATWPQPGRLHPEALYNEAGRLFAFAHTPLPGIHGSGDYVGFDGYSYCGLADADCAAREDARDEAALLTMAALLLDHRITTRGNP